MNTNDKRWLAEMLYAGARISANYCYPEVSIGATVVAHCGSEDGEYTETIPALSITWGKTFMLNLLVEASAALQNDTEIPKICLPAVTYFILSLPEYQDRIFKSIGEYDYEVDGHYERGATRESCVERVRARLIKDRKERKRIVDQLTEGV